MVPWAFYPALVTVPISPSTFTLLSYGGSLCNDLRNPVCLSFSGDIWKLSFTIRNTSNSTVNAGRWSRAKVSSPNGRTPILRSNPAMFLIDKQSLIVLFGGVALHGNETSKVDQELHLLSDLRTYNTATNEWKELHPQVLPTTICSLTDENLRNVYNKQQAVYVNDYQSMIITSLDNMQMIRITACSFVLGDVKIRCTDLGVDMPPVQGKPGSAPFYTMAAGNFEFYLMFYNIGSTNDLHMFSLRQTAISSIGERELSVHPIYRQDLMWQFPGYRNCYSAAPVQMTMEGNSHVMMYIFLGGWCPGHRSSPSITKYPDLSPLAVWFLIAGSYHSYSLIPTVQMLQFEPGPRLPRRMRHSVTRVENTAVLFGGRQYYQPSIFEYSKITWCFPLSANRFHWQAARLSSSRSVPHPRSHHLSCSYTYANVSGVIILGGVHGATTFHDLWLLNLTDPMTCTGNWMELTSRVVGGRIPFRRGYSMTKYGLTKVILFGGRSPDDMSSRRNGLDDFVRTSYLTLLDFASLNTIRLKTIPLQEPVPCRLRHSLSTYTADSFLLLGGYYFRSEGHGELARANISQLLRINQDDSVSVISFFNYTSVDHSVVQDYIFSGFQKYVHPRLLNNLVFLRLKRDEYGHKYCPVGHGWTEWSCKPCAEGNYSSSILEPCKACPSGLTSTVLGATHCTAIDPCTADYCHGKGHCFVDRQNRPYCKCNFGYLPDDNCKTPTVYLSQMAAFVFASVLALLFAFLIKFLRKRRALRRTEEQLQIKHRDLRRSERKLNEINRGAQLRWTDLTIRKQLPSGTCSKVYVADLSDMEVVAKKLPRHYSPARCRTSSYDIFLQEAEILRSLRHPNIVLFLGAGLDTVDECPFLVMEYLRRGSLYDNLHDPTVVIEQVDELRFGLDIARGMRYLHSSSPPQIHRDLKSPNLLVSDKWVVKIGDLEFARYLSLVQSDNQPRSRLQTSIRPDPGTNKPTCSETVRPTKEHNSKPEAVALTAAPPRRGSAFGSNNRNSLTAPLLQDEEGSSPQAETAASNANDRGSMSDGDESSKRASQPCTASQLPTRVGMTCGVGTDRWRPPETLSKNSYTEKSDVYR